MEPPRETERLAEDLLFCAILRPHRALDAGERRLIVAFFAACGVFISLPFFLLGAWPVVGFMGLEVGLIWLALRISAAQGANEEQIFLSRIELLVRRLDWRGRIVEAAFNPRWSQLEREEHPEWGLERLSVVQGRRRAVVGASLNNEDRADFAQAFARALGEAKR